MKVTIEVNSQAEAWDLIKASYYVAFLEEFWEWMNGKGRECSLLEAKEEFKKIALINGIPMVY